MGGLRARHEAAQLMYQVAYLKGDFPALLGLVKNNIDLFGLPEQFQTLLAAGQLEQIDKMVQPKAAPQLDPLHLLIVGLAWEIAREPGRAKPWREEAIRRLRLERPEYAVAADMLEHPNETALTDVIDLAIAPQAKAILLVALAQGHSSQAAAMRRAARDLNVRREFPFHWIDRLSAP